MRRGRYLLVEALKCPPKVAGFAMADWDRLIAQARAARLLPRLQVLLDEHGMLNNIPDFARSHLNAARIVAENEERVLRWEVNRIERAVSKSAIPMILLKGAAYVFAGLPLAKGRIASDVDLLVPEAKLGEVERRLLEHGWAHTKPEPYDQYYYRTWSHELPPLQHRERKTIVDVHHTILPPTGRVHPDPEKLFAAAVPATGVHFKVLAPADMVLHSAAHAFQDGDLQTGLRDLVDLDDLLRHFGSTPRFWDDLVARAEELELSRSLYYALRYSKLLFKTPIHDAVVAAAQSWRPALPVRGLMDRLVLDAVLADHQAQTPTPVVSGWLLYARSHWLRMPPWLLARHLLHQAIRR